MSQDTGDLGRLTPAPGSVKKDKRIGRGRGSGHGDRATRGNKGAQSRSGYRQPPWFEGGQMPINRRLPKRGFNPHLRVEYREVKVRDLARVSADVIGPVELRLAGLVGGAGPVVLLGDGEIDRPVKVAVHRVTASAREKIERAGGQVEIIPLDPIHRRVKKGPKVRRGRPSSSADQADRR